MQPLIPATPQDLAAAQARLARAKDADDEAQSDLRAAKSDATAAKKELATALRTWRQILREQGVRPVDQEDDEDEPQEDDEDELAEPVPAGARA